MTLNFAYNNNLDYSLCDISYCSHLGKIPMAVLCSIEKIVVFLCVPVMSIYVLASSYYFFLSLVVTHPWKVYCTASLTWSSSSRRQAISARIFSRVYPLSLFFSLISHSLLVFNLKCILF